MKKRYIVTKILWQIFLYLFEVIGISIIFTYLTTFMIPIELAFDFFERVLMCYTVYQILVLIILTNLNDIEKDSCLAYITNLKKCLLYIENKEEYIKQDILKNIDYQLDNSTLNDNKFRDSYILIKNNIDKLTVTSINMELIEAEHIYEMVSLNWRFSFILRLFK